MNVQRQRTGSKRRRVNSQVHHRTRRVLLEQLEQRNLLAVNTAGGGYVNEATTTLTVPIYDAVGKTINFSVSGTAVEGRDYDTLSRSIAISTNPGQLTIQLRDDDTWEPNETLRIQLEPGSGYVLDPYCNFQEFTIVDDDLFGLAFDSYGGCPTCSTFASTATNPLSAGPAARNVPSSGAGGDAGFTTAPIRYADGTVLVVSDDLQSEGFGMPWGVTRQWSNGPGYARENVVGSGMVVTQQPVLFRADGTYTMGLITDGHTVNYFDLVSGSYKARGYKQEELVYDALNDEWAVTTAGGSELRFYGFSGSLPAAQRGRFKRFDDGLGNTIDVVSHTMDGKIQEVQRSYTAGLNTTDESFSYAYVPSGTNAGLLESVTLRRRVNSGSWVTQRKVEYAYYGSSDANGNAGDLKTATIKDGASATLETTMYRYYKPSQSNGYTHGLKYVFFPASHARMVEALGSSLDSELDGAVAPFADHYFEYDGSQRATKEIAQGAGCSTCSGGQGTFALSYTTSANADGYNSWKTKTVETLPDGNENIVYTNYVGQVMLKVFHETSTGNKWGNYYQFDAAGRLLLRAEPSAISGYNDSYADLLHLSSGNYDYLRDNAGLISVFEYYASTTATTSVAGGVLGYLERMSIREGELGDDVPQSDTTYIGVTAGGDTRYYTAANTVYVNDDGTGGRTTSLSYTYFSGTTQIKSNTTTPPSGSGDASTVFYDAYGRPNWMRDANGFLHYTEYDSITGAVVKTIGDVDTTETSDFAGLPSGWTTPTGGGLHAITTYEVDGLGRTTKGTDPDGRVTYTVYDDVDREVRIYAGWNSTTNLPTAPTVVMREDRDGSYSEVLTMSATPTVSSGRPTGAESISNLQSLIRTFYNAAGQAIHTDEYVSFASLTYTAGTSLGTQGTHFYRTTNSYDSRGRHNKTVLENGTIFRTVFDGLGRPISEWIGDDDTPVSGSWSPSNAAGMQKVKEYEYDGGTVGDSNLTSVEDALGRVTEMDYDFRSQLVTLTLPDPDGVGSQTSPVKEYVYDNLGRQIEVTDVLGGVTTYSYDDVNNEVTVTAPDPDGGGSLLSPVTVSTTDGMGQTVLVVTPNGGESSYVFDGLGRVTSFTAADPDGAGTLTRPVTSYQYDLGGNLRFQADPLGNVTEYQYDLIGRLAKRIDPNPLGSTIVVSKQVASSADDGYFIYYSLGNTGQINLTEYGLKPYGYMRFDDMGIPQGATITSAHLQLADVSSRNTSAMAYQFQAFDQDDPTAPSSASDLSSRPLTSASVTSNYGTTTAGTFANGPDIASVIQEIVDRSGYAGGAIVATIKSTQTGDALVVSSFDTNTSLAPKLVVEYGSGPGPVTEYTYNAAGRLASVTNALGYATSYVYDALGRMLTKTEPDPDGTGSLTTLPTTYIYDSAGNLLQVTDPLGDYTQYEYDLRNNLTEITLPDPDDAGSLASPLWAFTFDAVGNKLTSTDPMSRVTSFDYDNLNRLTRETSPDPDGGGSLLAARVDYTYDKAGNVLSVTDRLGHATANVYDLLQRLTSTTNANSEVTSYTYDVMGNRLTLTDPESNTTTWDYDGLNRVVAETNELSDSRTFEYDSASNLTKKVDRLGRITEFNYDHLNRRTAEIWKNGSTTIRTMTFSYDAIGQLLNAADPASESEFVYDPLGRVTTETQEMAPKDSNHYVLGLTLTRTFDAAGNRVALTATYNETYDSGGGGRQTNTYHDFDNTYVFDSLHRLTRVDQTNQPGSAGTADDKRFEFLYNAAGQFTSIDNYADNSGNHIVTTYSYDGAGRLSSLDHHRNSTQLAGYDYEYDAANRITAITSFLDGLSEYNYDDASQLTDADHTGQTDEAYTYDDNGNRIMTGYVIGSNNRITSDGTYDYEYDNEGNRTAKETIATGAREEYTWDHRNRLTKVTFRSGSGTVTKTVDQAYDVFNRWIGSSVNSNSWSPQFFYDGDQIITQVAQVTYHRYRYLLGPAVDQVLAQDEVGWQNWNANQTYPLADHLGTGRDLATRTTGGAVSSVANHRRYDSYGNRVSETNSSVDFLFGYTGRPYDEDSKLQNNLHRWYDAGTGQWISEDPIGFAGLDENLRRYVSNRPTVLTDPTGRLPPGGSVYPQDPDDPEIWYPDKTGPKHVAWLRFLDILEEVRWSSIRPGGSNRCNRWAEVARNRIIARANEHAKYGNDPKEVYDNEFFVVEYVEFGFETPPMPGWSEHSGLKLTFKKSGEVFYFDVGTIDGIANHPLVGGLYLPGGKMTTPADVSACPGKWYEKRTDPLDEAKGMPNYIPTDELYWLLRGAFGR
jgi:RHS repeat-associated protein